jgi:hypothetical protein
MEEEKEGFYCYLCDYRTCKNTDWIKHQTGMVVIRKL